MIIGYQKKQTANNSSIAYLQGSSSAHGKAQPQTPAKLSREIPCANSTGSAHGAPVQFAATSISCPQNLTPIGQHHASKIAQHMLARITAGMDLSPATILHRGKNGGDLHLLVAPAAPIHPRRQESTAT